MKSQSIEKVKSIFNDQERPPIIEHDNKYWKYDGRSRTYVEISNFIIRNEVMIEGEEDSLRIVTIESSTHKTPSLIISYLAFTSKHNFIAFLEKHGNFFFKGVDKDLMEIKQMVFSDCQFIQNAERIGYNQKHECFVLANGIIKNGEFHSPSKLGIVEGIFIAASAVQNKNLVFYQSQRRYMFKNDSKLDLNSFIQLLTEIYDEYKVIVGISFLIASTCFDYIGSKLSFFPLLNLSGQPGSGKTTFARFLLGPFSSNPEVLMLSSVTPTGFMRKLEQSCNIPVILDEFKNSLYNNTLEALKNIYDLTGKTVGVKSNDNTTKQSRILSPAILVGQETPTSNEALLTRTIHLGFAPLKHESKRAKLFSELVKEQEKGLGDILIELTNLRSTIIQYFLTEYHVTIASIQKVVMELQNLGETRFMPDTRLIKNYACVLAPLVVAIKYRNLKILPNYPKDEVIERLINKIVIEGIRRQAFEEQASDEVNIFWEIFYNLIMDGKLIEDIDFFVDKKMDELWFYKTKVMSEYQKCGREIKGKAVTDSEAIISYFTTKDYFLGPAKKYYLTRIASDQKKKQKRSLGFRLSSLSELGIDL